MRVLNTSLCRSCKYSCKARGLIESCTSYKLGKQTSQGAQMSIYDCINGIKVDTLKGMEYKYGKIFEDE